MNIFRFIADSMHLVSILILLSKIKHNRSCSGISFKTQALYATVFITRYLDLFVSKQISTYNTIMKLFYIATSLYIVYLMRYKFYSTYDISLDTFKCEYLLALSTVLGLATTYLYSLFEVLWTFSIWLESVAILPQLFMVQKTGEAEIITSHYLFALGVYRAFYVFHWIYRYMAVGYIDWTSCIAGMVQTALYTDFFYIYYTKVLHGEKFQLPK